MTSSLHRMVIAEQKKLATFISRNFTSQQIDEAIRTWEMATTDSLQAIQEISGDLVILRLAKDLANGI